MEQTLLFRLRDGGKTWSEPEKVDLLGREPYLTVLPDGTVFLTGHLLANDVRNRWGYTCGFLHRSTGSCSTSRLARVSKAAASAPPCSSMTGRWSQPVRIAVKTTSRIWR
jgi:hypothetical protein